jgi:hypothetical protein
MGMEVHIGKPPHITEINMLTYRKQIIIVFTNSQVLMLLVVCTDNFKLKSSNGPLCTHKPMLLRILF